MTKQTTTSTSVDIAWAAGLLEGEGCFSIFNRKSAKWDHKSVAIHCEMTDEDTIMKLYKIFDVGSVNHRPNISKRIDQRSRKPSWIWSVQNHEGIEMVLVLIYPFLSERRSKKAKELLEYIEQRKNRLGDT